MGRMVNRRRWIELYNDIERAASRLGYAPPSDLALEGHSSQCYQFKLRGRAVVLVGFRDLARIPDYKAQDHLWSEGFGPIMRHFGRLLAADPDAELPAAFGVVVDNRAGAYVILPIMALFKAYDLRVRLRMGTLENLTFGILRSPDGYLLQTPYGADNLRLEDVDTIDLIVRALREAKNRSANPTPS